MEKQVKEIKFKNGLNKRYTGIVHIGIFASVHFKDMNYDEPVLYLQRRMKKHNMRGEKVTEICIPLSQILSMM